MDRWSLVIRDANRSWFEHHRLRVVVLFAALGSQAESRAGGLAHHDGLSTTEAAYLWRLPLYERWTAESLAGP